MRVTLVAGARPNFMKIAPIIHAFTDLQNESAISYRLVHTGQHYDQKMSETFFEELEIPAPHVNLGSGGGTPAEQAASIMVAFEKELKANPCDLVIVVGDVTSTMACTIVAKLQQIKVAHVEAGIRSYDLSMPEEINRMVTDAVADYFFTTSETANENLRKAGVSEERIFFVGNVMVDTLLKNMPKLRKPALYDEFGLSERNYIVLTLHRPANVDSKEKLGAFIREIEANAKDLKIVFPVHPRTRRTLEMLELESTRLILAEPMGYHEFNYLVKNARAVVTDSGGITEEATVMGIPCMTLRENTERPETCTVGTNELIGTDPRNIKGAFERLLSGNWKKGGIPQLWDGKAAERIANRIIGLHVR